MIDRDLFLTLNGMEASKTEPHAALSTSDMSQPVLNRCFANSSLVEVDFCVQLNHQDAGVAGCKVIGFIWQRNGRITDLTIFNYFSKQSLHIFILPNYHLQMSFNTINPGSPDDYKTQTPNLSPWNASKLQKVNVLLILNPIKEDIFKSLLNPIQEDFFKPIIVTDSDRFIPTTGQLIGSLYENILGSNCLCLCKIPWSGGGQFQLKIENGELTTRS